MPADIAWIVVAAMTAAAIVALGAMHRRNRAVVRSRRSSVFAPAYDLFDSYQVTQRGTDYPVLTGQYRKRTFQLDAITDTLTFRKLPVLWLRVSLLAPVPGSATLDILVRSQNAEFYSPSNELPYQVRPLVDWPADAIVRTDDERRLPDLSIVDRHMSVFERPATKELLITAKGVRLVHMLDQARRAEYLVLRQAEFENAAVDKELLRDLMDRAIALHNDLTRAEAQA